MRATTDWDVPMRAATCVWVNPLVARNSASLHRAARRALAASKTWGKAGSRAVDSAIISERKSRLIRLSLQTVPDALLLILPHRRAGPCLPELVPLRHLECGEAFGTVGLDRLGGEVGVGLPDDDRDHRLVADWVGDAHDANVEDAGAAEDRRLDLGTGDVLAGPLDQVAPAVDAREEAAG